MILLINYKNQSLNIPVLYLLSKKLKIYSLFKTIIDSLLFISRMSFFVTLYVIG